MMNGIDEIESLRHKVAELERENSRLKGLLLQHGIVDSYNVPPAKIQAAALEANQGARILTETITQNHPRQFFSYFWGRLDVFAKRFQNKTTGKTGYFPQCDNLWKKGVCPKASGSKVKCKGCSNRLWTKIEGRQIEKHLLGAKEDASDVIGIYPLFPDGTCRLLVFDFDNHSVDAPDFANTDALWIGEVNAMREICRMNGVPALVERSRSGKGAHLWIFFDKPVSASLVRRFGFALLDKGAEAVNMTSFRFYDRMLPAQDYLDDGELGNLIALPLQGKALKEGNSAFIDENWNAYPNQWETLLGTRKLTETEIRSLMLQWNVSEESNQVPLSSTDDTKPWERANHFHREDVSGDLSITLSDMIYVKVENLKPRLQNQIRRLAALLNPAFFRNSAMRISNFANSRYIYLGADDSGYICVPRGLLDELVNRCNEAGISYIVADKRVQGRTIKAEFIGQLRENQAKAVDTLLCFDNGILSAATAFGKTVVCGNIIARKKVSTLVLLESSALIEQWENSLSNFLSIDEELPEYKTTSGRIRRRKSLIGVVHGANTILTIDMDKRHK